MKAKDGDSLRLLDAERSLADASAAIKDATKATPAGKLLRRRRPSAAEPALPDAKVPQEQAFSARHAFLTASLASPSRRSSQRRADGDHEKPPTQQEKWKKVDPCRVTWHQGRACCRSWSGQGWLVVYLPRARRPVVAPELKRRKTARLAAASAVINRARVAESQGIKDEPPSRRHGRGRQPPSRRVVQPAQWPRSAGVRLHHPVALTLWPDRGRVRRRGAVWWMCGPATGAADLLSKLTDARAQLARHPRPHQERLSGCRRPAKPSRSPNSTPRERCWPRPEPNLCASAPLKEAWRADASTASAAGSTAWSVPRSREARSPNRRMVGRRSSPEPSSPALWTSVARAARTAPSALTAGPPSGGQQPGSIRRHRRDWRAELLAP